MKVTDKDFEKIKREVEMEFPEDPALQQVHMARKILAKEAREKGLSYFDHVKSLSEKKREKAAGKK